MVRRAVVPLKNVIGDLGEWFKPFVDYVHTHADIIRAVTNINAAWDAQALLSNLGK